MTSEAEFKRALVRQLLFEGGFGRRIEDKFAVGSLDMLLVTAKYTLYAEAKLLKGIAALPASVAQRNQIRIVNEVGNPYSRALIVGLKDKRVGFGLPGERWDEHYTIDWPNTNLTGHLNAAVMAVFKKEWLDEQTA
jgi:hypothetical protein